MGPGAFDRAVLDFFVRHRTPGVTSFLETIGQAGTNPQVMLAVALGVFLLVMVFGLYRVGGAVAGGTIVAYTIAKVAKDIIGRPRPTEHLTVLVGEGYAFPSTHGAFTSAAAAAFVTVVAWRSVRSRRAATVVAAVLVLFVGVAMVYLGSHWALDVLVGWCIGTPIGVLAGRLLRAPSSEAPAADAERAAGRAADEGRQPTS